MYSILALLYPINQHIKKMLQIIFGRDWRLVIAIRFSVGAGSNYKGLSHIITSSFVSAEKYLIGKSKNIKIIQFNLTMELVPVCNTLSLIFTLSTWDWLLTCSSWRKLTSWSLRSQLNRTVVSWSCLWPRQTGPRTCPGFTELFHCCCVTWRIFAR